MDFSEIVENAQEFLSERKKGVLISCILVLLFCAAFLVFSFGSEEKKSASATYTPEPFVADDELILPQGPSIPQSYTVTRQKKEKWESEEVERWLTKPDVSAVEKLSDANDDMIFRILGDAP